MYFNTKKHPYLLSWILERIGNIVKDNTLLQTGLHGDDLITAILVGLTWGISSIQPCQWYPIPMTSVWINRTIIEIKL